MGKCICQNNLELLFGKAEQNVIDIKSNDPEVICQAAIFEYVSPTIETFYIPDYVWNEFGIFGHDIPEDHKLNYENMLYPLPASQYKVWGIQMNDDLRAWIPDITQLHTQLWFYFLATKYINIQCEALHFGQNSIMNRRDVGNKVYWSLLERIRNYGKLHNRGLVLCDGEPAHYEPNLNISIEEWQDYKYTNENLNYLLFDFTASKLWIEEGENCTGLIQEGKIPNKVDFLNKNQNNIGGIHPQGFIVARNFTLYEIDHSDIEDIVGCDYDSINKDYSTYGWDEISWFASQPLYYRNEFLKYAYYKVKCMDNTGFLCMPGRRTIRLFPNFPRTTYRANYEYYNQEGTILNIWQGAFSGQNNMVRYDFTDDYVLNAPELGNSKNNIVFASENRIYYIGIDKLIHGYILFNGAWLTCSPSYAAGNVENQVKAAGDLIVNPSGTFIYYRGIDGLVYQIEIINDWEYSYSPMTTNDSMIQQNIRAVGPMLCSSDNRIYYVGLELSNGNVKRVHGFVMYGQSWQTVSPSHAAGDVSNQELVKDDLVVNQSGTVLYYCGFDGLIYQIEVVDDWNYIYSPLSSNQFMIQQNIRATGTLICVNEDKIFYIAKEISNGNVNRIHGLIKFGQSWQTVSPSWSSHFNGYDINLQKIAFNKLVFDTGNNILAYLGDDLEMHGFYVISDWDYLYFNYNVTPSNKKPIVGHAVNSEGKLFYISSIFGENKVHFFSSEEDFCNNVNIANIEPNCCFYLQDNTSYINLSNFSILQDSLNQNYKFLNPNTNDIIILIKSNPIMNNVLEVEILNYNFDYSLDCYIFDAYGKSVFSFQPRYSNFNVNLQDLPRGVYHLNIVSETGPHSLKFIIQ